MRTPSRALIALLCLSGPAFAQQIKSRVMVMIDTSASMEFYFGEPAVFANPPTGDYPGGDGSTLYSDKNLTNAFMYPGKDLGGGKRAGVNSRMYAAKASFNNAINAYSGLFDFGLMSYGFTLCPFNNPLCKLCKIVPQGQYLVYNCLYANNQFTKLVSINWQSTGCGNGSDAAILVPPGAGSSQKILPWIDGNEIHKTSGDNNNAYGTGSSPQNPELRGEGGAPLAEAIDYYHAVYYNTVKGADPKINCRPYVLVLATDAVQWCGNEPDLAAKSLLQENPNNPVKTYVIGLSVSPLDEGALNAIAKAGGTTQARFANSQADIEAAFADISSASVKYEICNGQDDNCDGLVDEGFDKGSACTVGVGACVRKGLKKCLKNGQGTQCCVDDGNANAACVPLIAGLSGVEACNSIDDDCNGVIDDPPVCVNGCKPTPEVCDGKDNDCDKIIDNNLVDTAKPCGLDLGACKPGTTACVADQGKVFPDATDHLVCQNQIGPKGETCNNVDDDCDGITDGITQICYSGAKPTDGVGICHGGQQKCTAGVFGACVGEAVPAVEVCNGLDDNCNLMVDDFPGSGASCCPSQKCGQGICVAGTLQCSGGSQQCIGGQGPLVEICNGLDDDCNGLVDDLPNLHKPCISGGGCGGTLECNLLAMQIVCKAAGVKNPEICNNADDDCDGKVDEEPDVSMNDKTVGASCGNDKGMPLPCQSGKTICKGGKLLCDGAIGPGSEVCDGKDNDCDGKTDNAAPCPKDFVCLLGQCNALCGSGEFPCAGGFNSQTVNGVCVCVPDKNCAQKCVAPNFCDPKTGMCVDQCAGRKCPNGQMCDHGICYGCEKFGCAAKPCTRCDKASHECVPDLCCNVKCDAPKFCDPNTGMCLSTCPNGCPQGEICDNGACVGDRCFQKNCKIYYACDPKDGECKPNTCASVVCVKNLACCNGQCVADPCQATVCPGVNTVCRVNEFTCQASCDLDAPLDRVVGAGGGAFGCSASGRGPAGWSHAALLLLAALLHRRRRSFPLPPGAAS